MATPVERLGKIRSSLRARVASGKMSTEAAAKRAIRAGRATGKMRTGGYNRQGMAAASPGKSKGKIKSMSKAKSGKGGSSTSGS